MTKIGWLVVLLLGGGALYLYSKRDGGDGGVKVRSGGTPGFDPPGLPNTGTGYRLSDIFGGFKSTPVFQTRRDTDNTPALIRASAEAFGGIVKTIQGFGKQPPARSTTKPDDYYFSAKDYAGDFGTSGNFEYTTD